MFRQTAPVNDDSETPSRPEPAAPPRRAFPLEAAALGVGVVVLLVVAVVTMLSLAGGDDAEQLSIGTTTNAPAVTFDASISDADRRDISITDEPIVIDADGNIVDPAGGNRGEPLPSESRSSDATLELPDGVYTGSTATTTATATATTDPVDNGTNLLGGDDPEDKLMPDLICRGLQAAQDEIQDHGVFGSKSKDATGQGRRQLWDRNWIVVAQDPEPGEKIGEFEAILFVVKKSDDENTCD